jgi:diphthamide synthase (EF-2-diphthine--ammonia ligase)
MEAFNAAREVFGFEGRLISQSKSRYRENYPDHTVVFNGNLCTKEIGKIWFGDIDVTLEKDKIDQLAKTIGMKVYVLYESDARFENERKPLFDRAVYIAE